MKKTSTKLALLLLAGLFLASCAKNLQPGDEIPFKPGKFSEIKTSPTFNWATTRNMVVYVEGISTTTPIMNTLLLHGKGNTSIYYGGNHLINENLTLKITVPTSLDSLRLTYGTIQKAYYIDANNLTVDYIINVPEEQ